LKKGLQRLASVQKKLSRQKKGSSNRSKQKRLYARVHEKLKNQRHDFIHQETAKLAVKNHATSFVLEDLNIMGMMKNGKLSRAIQDVAWGSFVSALEYKCERQGKNVIKIHRFESKFEALSSMRLSSRFTTFENGIVHLVFAFMIGM